jgi:hypothetical protein
VIVVVGRPGLDANDELDRPAGRTAIAAAAAGARVELVGAIGDDSAGDTVAVLLGKSGVGHAALLRDPAAVTPRVAGPAGPLPRLDGQDVELGLAYLADYRVLVIAEPSEPAILDAARSAASFQGADMVVVVAAGSAAPQNVPSTATVLELPDEDEGAFPALVGRYATELDRGTEPAEAWQSAVRAGGWEAALSESDAE